MAMLRYEVRYCVVSMTSGSRSGLFSHESAPWKLFLFES